MRPQSGSPSVRQRIARTLATFAGAGLVATCGLDAITAPQEPFELTLEGDTTLAIGESRPLVPTTAVAGALNGVRLRWSSSAPGSVRVDSLTGEVTGLTEGRALIRVRADAPDLPPNGVRAEIPMRSVYAALAIDPIDSLTGLGQSVTPSVQGLSTSNARIAGVNATITSSDTTVVRVLGTSIIARRNGTATISASYAGLTVQRPVRVRQVAKTVSFSVPTLTLRSLQRDTSITVTVRDVRDSVITAPTLAWMSSDTSVVSVNAAGIIRGRRVAASSIRVSADTVTRSFNTAVQQVPVAIVPIAGDGQIGRVAAALATAPEVEVRDAGGAPVPGASVVFVAGTGSGSVATPVVTTNSQGRASAGTWTLGTIVGPMVLQATQASLSAVFGATARPGPAAQMVWSSTPTTAAAGAVLTTIRVALLDQFGNAAATDTSAVTLATTAGALGGTTTRRAVAGVATFDDIVIAQAASGVSLGAVVTGLSPSSPSAPFNVLGAASRLRFVAQPSAATAGASIAPSVTVRVEDAVGNALPAATTSVSLALSANPTSDTLQGTRTAGVSGGVATFNDLRVRRVGSGYRISANAAGLAGDTSSAFSITPAAGSRLEFFAQPGSAFRGSAIASPAPSVRITDAFGNPVGGSAQISIALGANPGAATLSGDTTATAVGGTATFSNAVVSAAGVGYTLVASATGLTPATSALFTVRGPGTPRTLVFSAQPATAVAGAANPASIGVRVVDSVGVTVDLSGTPVTLELLANPGSATLSGTFTASTVRGVAIFSDVRLNRVSGGYTLRAISDALTPDTSAAFAVTAAAASRLEWLVQPGPAFRGAAISPAMQVRVTDAFGNLVSSSAAITLSIGTNAGGGVIGGTTTVNAVAGVATFGNVSVSTPGVGYTFFASSSGLTAATSTAFSVFGPGTPRDLVFLTQPSAATAGSANPASIQVRVVDSVGFTVDASNAAVTLELLANPGSATPSGTLTTNAVSGVATFTDVRLDRVGTGYTLRATSGTLTPDTSATFAVTAATASRLAWVTQPSQNFRGTPIAPAPSVRVTDAFGNAVTSTASIALSIGTNPGGGAIGGTPILNAVGGIAIFSNVNVSAAGVGYTLVASATGLTSATSDLFTVLGPGTPRELIFSTQPAAAVAGAANPTALSVRIVDSVGVTVDASTASVTLELVANPGSATLSGTMTTNAVAGVATFSDIRLNRVGSGYTLRAVSGALTPDTSATFAVTAAAASRLEWSTQPSQVFRATAIAPAPGVRVTDAFGNPVVSSANIALSIGTNAGGGTIGGVPTQAAVAGVASFSNVSISAAGVGYTLVAAATGLTSATSSTFTVLGPGTPRALVYMVEPAAAVAGAANPAAIAVWIVDSVGVRVDNSTLPVTLALADNAAGGTLSGTVTRNAVAGIATFTNVVLNRTGTGYTLQATGGGLTPDTSAAFAITPGTPSALAFAVQPTAAAAGAALAPAVAVNVVDNQGNLVPSATATVSLTISTNPGASTLTGGGPIAAVGGVATFSGISLNRVGSNYRLTAAATGLTSIASTQFNITAGDAAVLEITTQPASTAINTNLSSIVVTVRDAQGNTATSATMPVTLALLSNPSSATLGGTTTLNAVAGVATFTALQVNQPGQGFTLLATGAGPGGPLVADTSGAFNGIGPATALFFTTQPSNAVRNAVVTPAMVVEARDAAGNRATGYSGSVSMTILNNVNSAVLAGTTTRSASAGLATFTDVRLDSAGTGYTLSASAGAVTSAASAAFNIAAYGAATALVYSTQPSAADAGATISPTVAVEVRDVVGNRVANSSASVALAFGANPGAATLGGTSTVSAVNGVAQFPSLSVSAAGVAYTLTAASSGLGSVTSTAFNIVVAGSAVRLRFDVQPNNNVAGTAITPSIVVSAVNSSGGIVAAATGSITLAVDSGPVVATFASSNLVNGQATFTGVTPTIAGTYRLRATGAGLALGRSATFTTTHGFANKLGWVVQPLRTTAGITLSAPVRVEVQDVYGNRVLTAANAIKITDNGASTSWPCLDGDSLRTAVLGLASFSELRPRCANYTNGYSRGLWATSPGLTGASSDFYVVNAAPPSYLTVNQAPTSTTGRQPFFIRFAVRDSLDNHTVEGTPVSLSLGVNPSSGNLGGGLTATSAQCYLYNSGGNCYYTGPLVWLTIAAFNPVIDSLGSYTLVASAPGLTSVETAAINIVASTAAQLGFAVPPSNAIVGAAITPAMRVCVLDAYGNERRDAVGSLTLSLGINPGSATLGGTLTRTLTQGCANFSGVTVSAPGTGYSFLVTPTGISGVASGTYSSLFDISP